MEVPGEWVSLIHIVDGVLLVGFVPFSGTPEKGCNQMVNVSTNEVIKEIVMNADAIIREQGLSDDDPLGRMKTLTYMIENKGVSLSKQFTCVESTSRYAKDLCTEELESYENALTSILKNILEAKCNVQRLRSNMEAYRS